MINLIVTCARHLEGDTEDELIDILDKLGDSDVKIAVSNMSGIITVETKLDPIEVVRKMKEMLLDEPWSIRYCLRVIPVQKVVETNIDEINKIILIEILGIVTGISILKNSDILSVEITKRSMSD